MENNNSNTVSVQAGGNTEVAASKGIDTSNDILLDVLNTALALLRPIATSAIDSEIKSQQLDPWQHIAGGTASPGQYCVDFPWPVGKECVGCSASWNVTNFTGLSSLSINKFSAMQITSKGGGSYSAEVNLNVSLANSFKGEVSGSVGAKVGPVHPSVGLSGSITVNQPVASTTGTIELTFADGKVIVDSISLHAPHITTGSIDVSINGLGLFDFLASEVVSLIVAGFKPQLLNLLSSKLTPLLNNTINGELPYSS